jgi:hypothetical protein
MSEGTVDGYPRQIWWNADGETVVESYSVTDMAHGAPLGAAENDERYGAEGAFLIEAGISSSYHIARFFGLTEGISQPDVAATVAPNHLAEKSPMGATTRVSPDFAEARGPLPRPQSRPERRQNPRRRAIDISGVITRALTAAGLMK